MNLFGRFNLLSFLDLICCGFGGALLLFLIGVSATPRGGDVPTGSMVLVRVRHHAGPKAEVGIEYRRPNTRDWSRVGVGNAVVEGFSASSEPDSGSEAFVVLFAPEPGLWEFRPYLIDFPNRPEEGRATEVDLEITGENVAPLDRAVPVPMPGPGKTGQIVALRIQGVK